MKREDIRKDMTGRYSEPRLHLTTKKTKQNTTPLIFQVKLQAQFSVHTLFVHMVIL